MAKQEVDWDALNAWIAPRMNKGAQPLPPNIFLGMCTVSEVKARIKELLTDAGAYLLVLGKNYAKIKLWLEDDMVDKITINKDHGYGLEIAIEKRGRNAKKN